MKPTTLNTLLANQSQQFVSALMASANQCEALEAVEK